MPEFQQQRLARWLLEWQLDQELRNSRPIEEDETVIERAVVPLNPVVAVEPSPFDPNVKAGDIRLLSSTLAPAAELPIIIAVLQEWGAQFLVAPFSRFAEPATPDELLLRGEANADPDVRVLALWNARTVPLTMLKRSWCYGRLTEDELRDALTVFRDKLCDDYVPESLALRVGPPVAASWDPRHAYIAQGMALLAPLTQASMAAADEASISPYVLKRWTESVETVGARVPSANLPTVVAWHARHCFYPAQAPMLAMAAAAGTGECTILVFRVGQSGARLRLSEQIGKPGNYRARVIEDPNSELEGARLLTDQGMPLAVLQNGLSDREFEISNGMMLEKADGSIASLVEESGQE